MDILHYFNILIMSIEASEVNVTTDVVTIQEDPPSPPTLEDFAEVAGTLSPIIINPIADANMDDVILTDAPENAVAANRKICNLDEEIVRSQIAS